METTVAVDLGQVARELNLPPEAVERTIALLDDGNTVPFITRFRKDHTGGLDEEQIRSIESRVSKLRLLAERKQTIRKSIESQNKLTPELASLIDSAQSNKRLEDLYLPYKPKKQTLTTAARERGLEPLTNEILEQKPEAADLDQRAQAFVDTDKQVASAAEALLGVGHLIAEHFSEDAELRGRLRKILWRTGKLITSQVPPPKEEKPAVAPTADAAETPAAPAPVAEDPTAATAANEAPSTDETAETPASPSPAPPEPAIDAETPSVAAPSAAATGEAVEAASEPEAAKGEAAPANEANPSPQPEAEPESPAAEAASAAEPDAAATDSAAAPQTMPAVATKVAKAADKEKAAKEKKKKKKKTKQDEAFKDYYDFSEALTRLPPHRIMAINRGERAKAIRVRIDCDEAAMQTEAEQLLIPDDHAHADFLRSCLRDCLTRLVIPSLEREARRELTEKAEDHAIDVFAQNLRKLLLQPPLRGRRVLAIDPGFRSGCKIAVVDSFGEVLDHATVHVVGRDERRKSGRSLLVGLIKKFNVSVVAIGNGAASREAEQLVSGVINEELKDFDVAFVIVNEAGASVYSTSQIGREEFPKYDPTVRSAISIARRLLDPLSELVKINPAHIGVGMYQHDVKSKHLRETLDAVVESCVNFVGVDANTASPSLLRYVSGLNQLHARRLYEHRQQQGPYRRREQLKDAPHMGEAAFQQAAGFLKILGAEHPLDVTWIHPESYDLAEKVLAKVGVSLDDLKLNLTPEAEAFAFGNGKPESDQPPAPPKIFAESLMPPSPADSKQPAAEAPAADTPAAEEPASETPATEVAEETTPVAADAPVTDPPTAESPEAETAPDTEPATEVTPATPEPAAVDKAAEQQAAAEKLAEETAAARESWESALAEQRTKFESLAEKVSKLNVEELAKELDVGQLSLKYLLKAITRPGRDPRDDLPQPVLRRGILKLEDLQSGMELTGTVLNVVDFGAFVDIGLTDSGLVHISRLADRYVSDPHEVVSVGDVIQVWVMEVDTKRRRVSLTAIKPGTEKPKEERTRSRGKKKPAAAAGTPAAASAGQNKAGGRSEQRRDRPPRKGKGGRDQQRSAQPRAYEIVAQPKAAKPLKKKVLEGKEPMRSFSDLVQFYEEKDDTKQDQAKKK